MNGRDLIGFDMTNGRKDSFALSDARDGEMRTDRGTQDWGTAALLRAKQYQRVGAQRTNRRSQRCDENHQANAGSDRGVHTRTSGRGIEQHRLEQTTCSSGNDHAERESRGDSAKPAHER